MCQLPGIEGARASQTPRHRRLLGAHRAIVDQGPPARQAGRALCAAPASRCRGCVKVRPGSFPPRTTPCSPHARPLCVAVRRTSSAPQAHLCCPAVTVCFPWRSVPIRGDRRRPRRRGGSHQHQAQLHPGRDRPGRTPDRRPCITSLSAAMAHTEGLLAAGSPRGGRGALAPRASTAAHAASRPERPPAWSGLTEPDAGHGGSGPVP